MSGGGLSKKLLQLALSLMDTRSVCFELPVRNQKMVISVTYVF